MKHKKRTSYTKTLMRLFVAVALILTALTVYAALTDKLYADTLKQLTEVWYGGLTAVTAFYLWKSKNENRYKYGQLWIDKIADRYGIDAAARFYETNVKGD